MLSILIPVYNFDITVLVKTLHAQALATKIDFELICFDDGSEPFFKKINRKISELDKIIYKELPENLGRSKIRNELAKAARFDYLLFMDCDSKVVGPNYINNYIQHLDPDTLLYGGRVYDSNAPFDTKYKFHWFYGINREQVDYKIRQERPYHAFQTNNFLVPRKLFMDIQFDENLKQYGHEDTLFGFELKRRKITLIHLDNPLEHKGLEEAEVFLDKTRKGIENLLKLNEEYPFIETKLLKAYRFCKKTRMDFIFRWVYYKYKDKMEAKLKSDNPSLRTFDWYKLLSMFK